MDEWERFGEDLRRATMGESDDGDPFRTALEKIRDDDPDAGFTGGIGGATSPWMTAYNRIQKIAVDALRAAERPDKQ